MPIDDFLDSGVLSLDSDIQDRVTKASSRGNVLRYACVVECSSSRYYYLYVCFCLLYYKYCTCSICLEYMKMLFNYDCLSSSKLLDRPEGNKKKSTMKYNLTFM